MTCQLAGTRLEMRVPLSGDDGLEAGAQQLVIRIGPKGAPGDTHLIPGSPGGFA